MDGLTELESVTSAYQDTLHSHISILILHDTLTRHDLTSMTTEQQTNTNAPKRQHFAATIFIRTYRYTPLSLIE
jgi:hypothetical protein